MKMYKDIFYVYITVAMVGAIAIGGLIGTGIASRIALIGVLIVWLLLDGFVCTLFASKRTKRRNDLFANCSMDEFARECHVLDDKGAAQSDFLSKNEIKLSFAKGLYHLGKISDMETMLGQVMIYDNPRAQELDQQIRYYRDWAMCFIEKGDLVEARNNLDKCDEILSNPKFRKSKIKEYRESCDFVEELLNMRLGEVEGLEESLKERLDSAVDMIDKVVYSYRLGEVYWHNGKVEEAEEAFRFVAENGGDTFYAEKAKTILGRKGKQRVKISIPDLTNSR